ncbi:MAG: Gfo/Idh/MocA family oxidoreductase, partial [Gammaproteobacteria bacterium]|nr:Gfo/Idh/MocA family oxidoreductase [Gammaproteobacteria bacterium]
MFRIAIHGAGGIAAFHARSVAAIDDAELVAVSSRRAGSASAFCDAHGGRAYPDLERLLVAEKPDVLIVTTPSGAHLEPVLAAARHRVHVLCEKPLEIALARVDRMIEACDAVGVRLGGVFQQRMSPLYQMVHQACAQGRFGEQALINCYVPWWRDDAYYAPPRWQGSAALDGAGALMNQ